MPLPLDTVRESGPGAELAPLLQHVHGALPAHEVIAVAVGDVFAGRIALVSSFGAESAVLLHMLARVDRNVPVLFIDTGRHFPETLVYRDILIERLGLTDVRSVGPSAEEVARLDADLTRASWDPDGCCAFRKTAPLESALGPFSAWITGRKRFQASTRAVLPVFEADGERIKVNPLATWAPSDIAAYVRAHRLPPHLLVVRGYPSIGCAPCTTPVAPGEDARAGRWRDLSKVECGIHTSPDATPLHRQTVS